MTQPRNPRQVPPQFWSILAAALLLPLPAATAGAEDRMDELIQRLERQEQELQALRGEVRELREHGARPDPEHPEWRREDGEDTLTEYRNPAVRLDISGQVNQAFNLAADGRQTKGYFVDNDASLSRIRFAGVGTFDGGPDVGSTLEVSFSPNNSFDVSQDNEVAGSFIQVRRAEIFAMDERFGRVMLGQGSAAADNTAEYDLSLVGSPIMLSGISFFAGGLQFTDEYGLTGVTLDDAFFNFDGNRETRFRYDTPMWGPLQVSVSAGADQRYDAAITLGGDFDHWTGVELGGLTVLGALSIHDPNRDDTDFRVAGSGSLLHNASGVSLTVSGGFAEGTEGTPYNTYAKLGWDTSLLRFGPTGFGVDYTWTEDVSADGDQGQSVGLAAVQVFQDYGIEFYSQFRWFTLDRAESPSFDDMYIGTAGARIRF